MQWNSTKKPEKWKKHSVSIFVHFYPRKNVSTSDLSSSQITSVGKRNLGNISRPRRCLGLEKFFLGSFFLLRQKLGKTQIRRGQIFPGIKLDKYRNKILYLTIFSQYHGKKGFKWQCRSDFNSMKILTSIQCWIYKYSQYRS